MFCWHRNLTRKHRQARSISAGVRKFSKWSLKEEKHTMASRATCTCSGGIETWHANIGKIEVGARVWENAARLQSEMASAWSARIQAHSSSRPKTSCHGTSEESRKKGRDKRTCVASTKKNWGGKEKPAGHWFFSINSVPPSTKESIKWSVATSHNRWSPNPVHVLSHKSNCQDFAESGLQSHVVQQVLTREKRGGAHVIAVGLANLGHNYRQKEPGMSVCVCVCLFAGVCLQVFSSWEKMCVQCKECNRNNSLSRGAKSSF